jgi:type IV pilus assembly protein PilC
VEQGRSLAGGMLETGVFPPLTRQMVGIGEETARLDATCQHVAKLYEEELDAQLETLTSIIEPVLIVVIGGVIGAIVIALYLPLFDLITVVE